jgi:hypothetical protein
LKLVCKVNIVYGNLKSENPKDDAQKPQRKCTFMNSASGQVVFYFLFQEVWLVYVDSLFTLAYTLIIHTTTFTLILTGNEKNPVLVLSNVHKRTSARDGPMFGSMGLSMYTTSLFPPVFSSHQPKHTHTEPYIDNLAYF